MIHQEYVILTLKIKNFSIIIGSIKVSIKTVEWEKLFVTQMSGKEVVYKQIQNFCDLKNLTENGKIFQYILSIKRKLKWAINIKICSTKFNYEN